MRPIRLELEGFTAYRELTVCDFEGAELFVLTGPTGSGKSSIIDAITFALYGSVPRYQNPNLVHPVVSQGKVETKVRFDFSVAGRRYTAVRVVRRTRGGATTREARLESEGRVLAGNADELSARVRDLLGLSFEQFNTCVVLPQGEFARFLHEKPAERQDLLTKLLGLDVYEKMGSLARVREAEAKQGIRLHEQELERLQDTTDAAHKKAKRRVSDVTKLKKEIESAEPELDRLEKRAESERTGAARLEKEAELLERLEAPAEVRRLGVKTRSARAKLEEATGRRAAAEDALSAAEKKSAALPDAWQLHEARKAHRELASKKDELPGMEAESMEALEAVKRNEEAKRRAEEAIEKLRSELATVRRQLAAHDLAAHLEVGRPCPVCQQEVESLPRVTIPPALANAEKALAKAEKAKARADATWHEATQKAALASERLSRTRREVEALEKKLEKAPSANALARELEAVESAAKELTRARDEAAKARETEVRARKEIERLRVEERRAWKGYDEVRDAVSSLTPPPSERDDLELSWKTLTDWAAERLPEQRALAAKAAESAREAESERVRRLSEIATSCSELGVVIERERPRDGVVSELARAEAEVARIASAVERAAFLRAAIETERERARVAGALGQHLRATGFERWLLEESFRRLVSGASVILRELSSGQYSFEHDDRLNFEVVDHRNADERRSARTLSGGETFLASLALALTLADETAELAAQGSAKLESLFLDEGFGTLDDETLEVVASAIAELGARGRVVGVVTHQPNLAATIPVQYRVTKNPATSTVTKVVA